LRFATPQILIAKSTYID